MGIEKLGGTIVPNHVVGSAYLNAEFALRSEDFSSQISGDAAFFVESSELGGGWTRDRDDEVEQGLRLSLEQERNLEHERSGRFGGGTSPGGPNWRVEDGLESSSALGFWEDDISEKFAIRLSFTEVGRRRKFVDDLRSNCRIVREEIGSARVGIEKHRVESFEQAGSER